MCLKGMVWDPGYFPLESISSVEYDTLSRIVRNLKVFYYLKSKKLVHHSFVDAGKTHKTPRSENSCYYSQQTKHHELQVHIGFCCSPSTPKPNKGIEAQVNIAHGVDLGLSHSWGTLSWGNANSLKKPANKPAQVLLWRETDVIFIFLVKEQFCSLPHRKTLSS